MSGTDIYLLPNNLIYIKHSLPEVMKLFHRWNLFDLNVEKKSVNIYLT